LLSIELNGTDSNAVATGWGQIVTPEKQSVGMRRFDMIDKDPIKPDFF